MILGEPAKIIQMFWRTLTNPSMSTPVNFINNTSGAPETDL